MARTGRTGKTLLALGIVVLMMSAYSLTMALASSSNDLSLTGLIRVACVGDSITAGSGYPEDLQTMLGDNYWVGNFGVCGSTVRLDTDLPYMTQQAFQQAKNFHPSIVVIMLGTNDAKENASNGDAYFQADYKKLIDAYQTLQSNPSVWLVKPPPLFENNLNLTDTNLEQDIIPSIDQVANELALPTINVNLALTNHAEYFGDGVHPNSDAAFLIANEINQALTADNFQINGF
jgi:lysophospholipase L1-like esterase